MSYKSTKVQEAKQILKELGVDNNRQNDRSAWTFLALLDMKPTKKWRDATAPLLQTFVIMEFIKNEYGQDYKPNSRETIRRQTLHQFDQLGISIRNIDKPDRATNSKNNNYSITKEALEVIKLFPSKKWKIAAKKFKKNIPKIIQSHKETQSTYKIDFKLPNGSKISLSPGPHNQVHADVITKFIPQFIGVKNSEVLYIGDTASSREGEGGKFMHLKIERFKDLGLPTLHHDKLPDLVIFDNKKKWLFLVEAVTSHGPVSKKRYLELSKMFSSSQVGVVYITAFPDIKEFRKNAADIAWETEVWISTDPEHMIHFNGNKFMGPYSSGAVR